MSTPVLNPDGDPFQLQFTAGLPGPVDGHCIFLLDDGSLHAGAICRDSMSFPEGSVITTNPAGGVQEKFEVPLVRVVGWASAAPRDRGRQFGRTSPR